LRSRTLKKKEKNFETERKRGGGVTLKTREDN